MYLARNVCGHSIGPDADLLIGWQSRVSNSGPALFRGTSSMQRARQVASREEMEAVP